MSFKQVGATSTLNGKPLILVDQSVYLDSNISSTESNICIYIGKSVTAMDKWSNIWKFYLSDKIKWVEKVGCEQHKDTACSFH